MADRIEVWGRSFIRPRFDFIRPAPGHPLVVWNRYGGIPGTPGRCPVTDYQSKLRRATAAANKARPGRRAA